MNRLYGQLVPIREQIQDDVLAGQRVSLAEIAKTIEDEAGYSEMKAYVAAGGLISRLRNRLASQGQPLVRLPDGSYGLPRKQDEVEYAMGNYGLAFERLLLHTSVLKQYAGVKGLLPKSFTESTIKIPAFTVK